MPSTFDRAVALARRNSELALAPAAATLLSASELRRALAADGGGGVTFPLPTGVPTLWTYVALPSDPGGLLPSPEGVVLPVVGVLVGAALEAGLLGVVDDRLDGRRGSFAASVGRFGGRMVVVGVLRAAVVVAAAPLLAVPPLAIAVVLGLTYLGYGTPFDVVARDVGVREALAHSVARALSGGRYARFALAHLAAGAAASLALSPLVRAGLPGVVVGAAAVSLPAVAVAAYGVALFREFAGRASGGGTGGGGSAGDDPDRPAG